MTANGCPPGAVTAPAAPFTSAGWEKGASREWLSACPATALAPLTIWLVYKDGSERVHFYALQALWYQVAWIGIFVAYFIVATILSIVTFGIAAVILFPLMAILPFAPLVHGCYAAYRVSQGEDYRYPFVADRIDGGIHRVA